MSTGDTDLKEYVDGTIRGWSMEAKIEEDKYVFHLVEPGRLGQYYFLHEKDCTEEAERWLDECFKQILREYGADRCNKLLQGKVHV